MDRCIDKREEQRKQIRVEERIQEYVIPRDGGKRRVEQSVETIQPRQKERKQARENYPEGVFQHPGEPELKCHLRHLASTAYAKVWISDFQILQALSP